MAEGLSNAFGKDASGRRSCCMRATIAATTPVGMSKRAAAEDRRCSRHHGTEARSRRQGRGGRRHGRRHDARRAAYRDHHPRSFVLLLLLFFRLRMLSKLDRVGMRMGPIVCDWCRLSCLARNFACRYNFGSSTTRIRRRGRRARGPCCTNLLLVLLFEHALFSR